MADKQTIDKAIAAHGVWKMRLRSAIGGGKLDIPPSTIRLDNHCDFGKWLHGSDVPAQDRSSTHYRTVKKLHAEFHGAAARVAELALAGKLEDAKRLMASRGEYTAVSDKLQEALIAWKEDNA